MTPEIVIGLCPRCRELLRVPMYSSPPARPSCACAPQAAPQDASGLKAYEEVFLQSISLLRETCQGEDVPHTFLRMQAFLGAAGAAYSQGDGKAFVAALASLSALARVLSETVEEDPHDACPAPSLQAGSDSEDR